MSEIVLYGSVGASFWGEEYFTARQVLDQLRAASGPLTVRINSGGGVADEGTAIYNALRDYPGEVSVIVDGAAASAASVIAMGGDRITVRRGAYLLIHDPASLFTQGRGTEDDHMQMARQLRTASKIYADIYASRSGMPHDEVREMMRADTVLDGEAAVMMGLADEYDDQTQAAIAAHFDYRIYLNAPEAAREASKSIGADAPGRMALVAMMAGHPAQSTERNRTMTEHTVDTTAEVVSVEEETVEAQAPAEAPITARADTIAERTRVRRILDTVTAAKLPVTLAHELIDNGTPADEAATIILRKWKEAGDVDIPMQGRPTAHIQRDERDTRREGMAGALVAQMGRARDVEGPARDFMGMSLSEMAATCAGYRGPLRTVADRLHAFEMASHSTSDFPAIFENALNKQLLQRYIDATPRYRRIARQVTFNDFRPHPMVRAGDFPMLSEIAEGGEITYGTFGESKETVAVKPYGKAVRISRQMLVNDDMNALGQVIADQGRAIARFEEAIFFAMFLSGANSDGPTLLSTTRQVFNTTDTSKAGTASIIDVTNLNLGRAALRKRTGIDGNDLDIEPSILMVGPDRETQAEQVVGPLVPAQASNVNPFSGKFEIVVTPKITGNAWYLMPEPADYPNFVWGLLSGFEGPRMRTEEPFGQQGVVMSLEHDFGVGAIDNKAWRNAGA